MAQVQYGRYETVGLIASGGMANVYVGRARGPAGFERMVAVKVMHEHIAADPEFSAMFLDEARLAARIRHPNVVPTLDVSEDGRIIVMEYVEGASLNDVLRRQRRCDDGCLPLPVTLRIILDVLDGLHAAHELCEQDRTPLNLVHRDVSPHNILVGVDGVARITDFGIAFAEARLTSTQKGRLKGKMPYMAPEQLEGASVDRRVDVYAAGCVLWEMLAGRRLFQADNEAALACRVLAGPEQSPRALNENVPPALAGACMRALEERGRRYPTALEFCEALEEAARREELDIARPRTVGAVARKATTSLGSLLEANRDDLSEPSTRRAVSTNSAVDLGADSAPPTPSTAVPTPPTADPLTVSATAALGTAGSHDDVPLAERPVTAHGASPAQLDQRHTLISAGEPPAISAVEIPAADRTQTDASIVAPVSLERRRGGARWLFAFAAAVAVTGLAAWLLLRTPSSADEGDPDPTSAEVATEPSGTAAITDGTLGPTSQSRGAAGGGPSPTDTPSNRSSAEDSTASGIHGGKPHAAPGGVLPRPRLPGGAGAGRAGGAVDPTAPRATPAAPPATPASPPATSTAAAPSTPPPAPEPSSTSTVFHPPKL